MDEMIMSRLCQLYWLMEWLMVHDPSSVDPASVDPASVDPMLKQSGRRCRCRCCVGVNGIARTTMNFIVTRSILAGRI
jgi:hypothetical protein